MNSFYIIISNSKKNNNDKKNGYIKWLFSIPAWIIIIMMIYLMFKLSFEYLFEGNGVFELSTFLLWIKYLIIFLFMLCIFIIIYNLR